MVQEAEALPTRDGIHVPAGGGNHGRIGIAMGFWTSPPGPPSLSLWLGANSSLSFSGAERLLVVEAKTVEDQGRSGEWPLWQVSFCCCGSNWGWGVQKHVEAGVLEK